jgi:hypothetical protein
MAGPTFRAGASAANSPTVSKPTGTADGDMLLASITWYDSSGSTITPPSGWTQLDRGDTVDAHTSGASFWKIASGEGASWTWTISGTPYTESQVIALIPSSGSAAVDQHTVGTQVTPETMSAPSVTTTLNDELLVCFFSGYSNIITGTPTGMTVGVSVFDSTNAGYYQAIASAGATGTKSTTNSAAATCDTVTFSISVSDGSSTSGATPVGFHNADVLVPVHMRRRTAIPY